jgi:uncharacterized protein
VTLPVFRYHPDPIASGSVVESDAVCACCGKSRGYIYTTPIYSEDELGDGVCPWCIADGSAHRKLDATFVDPEAFADTTPETAIDEISQRTPGYSAWQGEQWPACCDDATAFLEPVGIKEIRERYRPIEGAVLSHIIYEMGISGGAATRLLGELNREQGPTAYLFRCLTCEGYKVHIDRP